MRTFAGSSAHVHFTHLSKTASEALETSFASRSGEGLAAASCHQIGVLDLMKRENVDLSSVCLLDPRAEKEISPEDGDGRFQWFLFGVWLASH
jgi:ribosome biogenesis SPOUT family RNA methylase Rps3